MPVPRPQPQDSCPQQTQSLAQPPSCLYLTPVSGIQIKRASFATPHAMLTRERPPKWKKQGTVGDAARSVGGMAGRASAALRLRLCLSIQQYNCCSHTAASGNAPQSPHPTPLEEGSGRTPQPLKPHLRSRQGLCPSQNGRSRALGLLLHSDRAFISSACSGASAPALAVAAVPI